jgi:hypothetical protein
MSVFELYILNFDGQTFTQLCQSYEKAYWLLTQHVGSDNVGGVEVYTGCSSGECNGVQWYITELSVI